MLKQMFMRNEIKNIRKKLGFTRSQLAATLGVKYSTIYNWENEGKNPCLLNCYKLIDVCRHNGIRITVQEIVPPK